MPETVKKSAGNLPGPGPMAPSIKITPGEAALIKRALANPIRKPSNIADKALALLVIDLATGH